MNPIEGICRIHKTDERKINGYKNRKGYLDAAWTCAQKGIRLATKAEIDAAMATKATQKLNPEAILDTCADGLIPGPVDTTENTGCGWYDEVTKQSCLGCEEELGPAGDRSDVNVWTYEGDEVNIKTGVLASTININADQRNLNPILCYYGPNIDHPYRGYSVKVRCKDTGTNDIDENELLYKNGQKNDRYIFVQVKDVGEHPFFLPKNVELYVNENSHNNVVVYNYTATDIDFSQSIDLAFKPITIHSCYDQKICPFRGNKYIPINGRNSMGVLQVNGILNYEVKKVYHFFIET